MGREKSYTLEAPPTWPRPYRSAGQHHTDGLDDAMVYLGYIFVTDWALVGRAHYKGNKLQGTVAFMPTAFEAALRAADKALENDTTEEKKE